MLTKIKVERIFDILQYQMENYPLDACLVTKRSGIWHKTSTLEYIALSNKVSRGLLRLGIKPQDKIAVVSSRNCAYWHALDIAMLQIGAQNVPIYPTLSLLEIAYIINHSEAVMCFVSDEELFRKIEAVKQNTPLLKTICVYGDSEGCQNWSEILLLGEDTSNQSTVEAIKAKITGKSLASIVYTSGTTGVPNGVMLSHENIVSNVIASRERLPVSSGSRALSFLPTCHVYERTACYLYQYAGVSLHFAEAIETIGNDLKDVKPHIMTAVPRVIEKLYDKIYIAGRNLKGIKRLLFMWAVDLGMKYEQCRKNGAWYELKLKIANALIFSKWRQALGGSLKVIVCGSAALQPRLARLFSAAQIIILEGYGTTETSPVISVGDIFKSYLKFGTTGHVIDGVEVKIAEDGEILCKGPNVMLGYYKDPEKTAEVVKDGYYHTGDIGELDEEGFLKIIDRKKEIFKTSGGKYVAPQYIENIMKQSPLIEQIMVIGEGEKMPAAIIQPNFEYLKMWAKLHQKDWADTISGEELIAKPEVCERIAKEVNMYNAQFSKWEQLKAFELTPDVWSADGGLLTPTMKMKRRAIKEKYMHLYRKIYQQT